MPRSSHFFPAPVSSWFAADIDFERVSMVNGFILELRSDRHVCNDMAINTYLRGLRAFLYYCMEMDYMADFKIRIPKVDKKLKETYTDMELNVLLKKPNLKTCGFSEYKIWVFCA